MKKETLDIDTVLIKKEFLHFSEIDSTNSYLLDNNVENGTVVLADFQTAGRGRLSRKWEAPKEDALLFSLSITQDLEHYHPAAFTFVSSIAVLEGLQKIYMDLPAILKWPNDLLIEGKKISGILVESRSTGNKITKVVIGIGININQNEDFFDAEALKHGTSLKLATGQEGDRIFILENILESLEENLLFAKEKDISAVLNKWKRYCPYIGKEVTLQEKNHIHKGIFEDMNHEGGIVLNVEGKTKIFYAADVTIDKESL